MGGLARQEYGWSIGVGDQQRLGRPEVDAPEGLIAEFLEDHPEFRTRSIGNHTDAHGRAWEARLAWWFLPQAGRDVLQLERRAGLYGGPAYARGEAARYFYVQSADFPAWQESAYSAGLEEGDSPHFTTRTLAAWRDRLPQMVREALVAN